MKLECLKKDIEEAVEMASRAISNSATLPVLRCVVLETKGKSELELKATNLELGIKKTIQVDTKKDGKVAIPVQILGAALKTPSSQTKIGIETTEGSVVVTTGESKTTIKTIPVDDFPKIPNPEAKDTYLVPTEVLVKGIRSVLHSVSTSLIKPELASVYMHHEDNHLLFVATDSFRLAEKKVVYKTDSEFPTAILPAKNITDVIRILELQPPGNIELIIDENQCSIKRDGLYITSRIIDGSFPDYKSILPKEKTTEVVVLKEDLLAALRKAQIFSDKFGQVSLHIYPQKKTFTVSARNNDVGEVFASLTATITGEELDINFNHRYLLDFFQSISTDSVSLTFSGLGRPLILRGVGDSSFSYLVMPMNR
ncbi:DNA polymerase III subunit beta [bacterium]|nr:DNA polymerase III subunit beta [bacterium]|tara:strand:- start:4362 stop:5468 length:1107 start_codon:yes stop_codon:yes gene_type:complete